MSKTEIGMWVSELLNLKIPEQKRLHPWVPNGLTILAGAPKVGKSTLAEQIALEVSEQSNVIYLALEYSIPVAQSRFSRFGNKEDKIPAIRLGKRELIPAYWVDDYFLNPVKVN